MAIEIHPPVAENVHCVETTCRSCGKALLAVVSDDDEVRDECEKCIRNAAIEAARRRADSGGS